MEPHVAIRLRRVFGRAGKQTGTITMRDTEEVCRDLRWFAERYPIVFSDTQHLNEKADAHAARTESFVQILDGRIPPRAFEMALPPRQYQSVAAELALRAHGLLIADDVGLGKTATAIAALTPPGTRPAVVVTLVHLQTQWKRELAKFAPDLLVHIVKKGTPYPLVREGKRGQRDLFARDPDVIIISYHKLSGWADTLRRVAKTIVFDECQELRHSGSYKYGAADTIARDAEWVIGLSATPIHNYGSEIFTVMEILRPSMLGTWREFQLEWLGGGEDTVADPRALGTYLRDHGMMIRRTRAEVGRELPPLIKIPHHIDADSDALDEASDAVAELARLILDNTADAAERWNASSEIDWRLRQATGLAKAPHVADFVRMLLESVPKIVLYGWHRTVYDVWLDRLKDHKPVMFTGSESPSQKQAAIDAFVKGDARVLIISLRAGAGIDGLQGVCSTVVFGELDWSPAVHEQDAGRLHRDGQEESVAAYFLVSDSGSDPFVAEVLGLKKSQLDGIRDPEGAALAEKIEGTGKRIREMAEAVLAARGVRGSEGPA